ncbi:E3 ubiquitin-protein ligase RHF2A [Platanthera guangdongensis]|uniref:E3 ubiquitin-protein ligase RHF2A n=1 Tax=Platanthera guangdongensis TaxID=2320717 RepID=A0ABR2LIT4_9ASPA
MADIGSEVKREVSAGIASVSRMMERLDTRENRRNGDGSNVLERVAEDRRSALASASSAPNSQAATSN